MYVKFIPSLKKHRLQGGSFPPFIYRNLTVQWCQCNFTVKRLIAVDILTECHGPVGAGNAAAPQREAASQNLR